MGLRNAIAKMRTNYRVRMALKKEAEMRGAYNELHTNVLSLLVQRNKELKRGKPAVPKRHDWSVNEKELEFAKRLAEKINAAESETQLNDCLGALRKRAEWWFDPELTRALLKLSVGKKELIQLMVS